MTTRISYPAQAALRARIWGPTLLATHVAAAEAADIPEPTPRWEGVRQWLGERREALRARLQSDRHKQLATFTDREACQVWVLQTAARIYRDSGWRPPVQLCMDEVGRWHVRTGAR